MDPDLRQRLGIVNEPRLPPVIGRSWELRKQAISAEEHEEEKEDGYYFGLDIGPYWMGPLGDCFGVSQARVERAAKRVIHVDWKIVRGANRCEDQRARRVLYRESDTTHSHGLSPRTDDLNFYLSYHAMMIVAGELLTTTPPIHDSEYSTDDFTRWLDRHGLSLADGKWLADRRDPLPLERPDWRASEETDEWPWSIQRGDFDNVLRPAEGCITIWGDWSAWAGTRLEDVEVRSALVCRDRSESLLKALQSAERSSYRVPSAGGDSEISCRAFDLKGWIVTEYRENALDKFDPWGADIKIPPLRPAPFVMELTGLKSDPEHRQWSIGEIQDRPVLQSRVWGQHHEGNDDRDDDRDFEHGSRLQASTPFILDVLRKMGRDLIVCVQIRRDFRDTRYGRRRENGFEYLLPSARFFLVRPDGNIVAL